VPNYSGDVLIWMIVVPLAVAGATSLLLVRREAATAAGSGVKHSPRAAGFGHGGQPVPVEANGDAGLKSLLQPDYYRPWWLRLLRFLALAVLVAVVAAIVAAGIYEIGRWVGQVLKDFVARG
jgi:hypothetical protein